MTIMGGDRILVADSGSCGEAEFESCQVAGSLPVQWRAGPECFQPEEVEGGGHVHVVEAGLSDPLLTRRSPGCLRWGRAPASMSER
jgi:hypothetical protein